MLESEIPCFFGCLRYVHSISLLFIRFNRLFIINQALYETALLAYASQSPRVSSLSIAVVGAKGFEILACALPLCSLDFTFQKIISKLKQQLKIPPAVRLTSSLQHFGSDHSFLRVPSTHTGEASAIC